MPAPDTTKDFPSMYRRELGYVWKVLARLGVPSTDREDVAHDVFVAAFRQWQAYDQTRPIRPWLFGFAYRIVLDRKRKSKIASR
jgi:RNA polymerase sigma-70 factor (ECF subfamily)